MAWLQIAKETLSKLKELEWWIMNAVRIECELTGKPFRFLFLSKMSFRFKNCLNFRVSVQKNYFQTNIFFNHAHLVAGNSSFSFRLVKTFNSIADFDASSLLPWHFSAWLPFFSWFAIYYKSTYEIRINLWTDLI